MEHVSLLAGLYARELTVSVCPNPRLQVRAPRDSIADETVLIATLTVVTVACWVDPALELRRPCHSAKNL
jgi:hypothetical protein